MERIKVNLEPADLTETILSIILDNTVNNSNADKLNGGEVFRSPSYNSDGYYNGVFYKLVLFDKEVYLIECNEYGELMNDFDLSREEDRDYIKNNYTPMSEYFVLGTLAHFILNLTLILK